jgi:hypothetical protein
LGIALHVALRNPGGEHLYEYLTLYRVKDGKIRERWAYGDRNFPAPAGFQQGRVVGDEAFQDEIGQVEGRRLKGKTRGRPKRADHASEIGL